jgi:hypothetical protein
LDFLNYFYSLLFYQKNLKISDSNGKWIQITRNGIADVDFTGFKFNKNSGEFRDSLIFVTATPKWSKKLFIQKSEISEITDSKGKIIFEPVCQARKLVAGIFYQLVFDSYLKCFYSSQGPSDKYLINFPGSLNDAVQTLQEIVKYYLKLLLLIK